MSNLLSMGPTPLRDDQSHARSLSLSERDFVRRTISSSTRLDGRTRNESRSLLLTFLRSHGRASCSARFGPSTRATSSVTAELIPPPNPDRPNDGQLRFDVELSPMASAGFCARDDSGAQALLANRTGRILEKMVREGGAIDVEALCVRSGEWVWRLNVRVAVLDHGGNLVDCAILSAISALCHFRLPVVAMEGDRVEICHADDREPSPLPLHHVPVPVSFALFGDGSQSASEIVAVMDPSDREEMVCQGTLTFCFNVHGELCCLDFPGGCELPGDALMRSARVAEKKAVELCRVLERALERADAKAIEERKERAKRLFAAEEVAPVADAREVEEEKYRMQALDFAIGHIAAGVRDDDSPPVVAAANQPVSSLLEAMIKASSASISQTRGYPPNHHDPNRPAKDDDAMNLDDHREQSTEDATREEASASLTPNSEDDPRKDTQDMVVAHDSDDEEEVTILHGEFAPPQNVPAPPMARTKETPAEKKAEKPDRSKAVPDDVDDLAMAIKKKKSGKKKKSKKK